MPKVEAKSRRGSNGGLGKTRKHPQEMRRVAEYLYQHTPATRAECAELLGIGSSVIWSWWRRMPLPPHRAGVQGKPAEDQVAVLREQLEASRAEVERLSKTVARQTGEAPAGVAGLIKRTQERLAEAVEGGAKAGELAQVLRALVEVRREEAEQALADRVQIVYYLPERPIRPEDLLPKIPPPPKAS